ncbi:MAG: GAF domain-containing protein [Anaerolineales bacterium]|nr:GAF domain-containing protein [Anaerolineales bacterium]
MSFGLFVTFLIAGLFLVLLLLGIVRLLPRVQVTSNKSSYTVQAESVGTDYSVEAALTVQAGGRVDYVNSLARQLFGLKSDEYPDLERLVRQVRPRDEFLDMCVTPGHKRLSINGQLIDATAFLIPGNYPLTMIILRRPEFTGTLSATQAISPSILKLVTDFGQAVSANIDLEAAISAVLENVSRLVLADVMEVKVWDETKQNMEIYSYGEQTKIEAGLKRIEKSIFGALTDAVIRERKPLFVPEVSSFDGISRQDNSIGPSLVRSYIGLPLFVGSEFVGLLELGQMASDAFMQDDLNLLELIAGQAAVVIRNAVLYNDQKRRTAELTGLANLAQAVSSSKGNRDLFARLVESVTVLFDVEILGFLLYDEQSYVLEGQIPFQGLPPHVVEIYRTVLKPEGPVEKLLSDPKPILTIDAVTDENWGLLGLQDFARAASLHESALFPLLSGGRFIGYLQLSNHRDDKDFFTDQELRLARIVSNQAAAVIDNAMLLQDSRLRAQRSDSLRRIASLSASTATLDEVLRFSMQELANQLRVNAGLVYLLDEQQNGLHLHFDSVWGCEQKAVEPFSRLFVDETFVNDTATTVQQTVVSGQLINDGIPPVYLPLINALQFLSVIIVPLVVRESNVGVLVLGCNKANFFTNYDLQVVATAAGQLASSVEGASLMTQTDDTLRSRVEQLTALSRINRELSATLDLQHLLEVIHVESLKITHADCGTVMLFDHDPKASEQKVVFFVGCPVPGSLTEFERNVVLQGSPVILDDLGEEVAAHEDIRSALLTPISYQGKTAGLIHLHSGRVNAFNEETLKIAQGLAVQAAIAIGNAQRYQEQLEHSQLLHRRADTLSTLTDTTYEIGIDNVLESSLSRIAHGIRKSTPYEVIQISVYERDSDMLERVVGLGVPDNEDESVAHKQSLKNLQVALKPEYMVSRSYFIPADEKPFEPSSVNLALGPDKNKVNGSHAWNAGDFLVIPLNDAKGNPLGIISVEKPQDGLRPDQATIETLEAFAAQAAITISSTSRFKEMGEHIQTLTAGLERQERLISVSQGDLPLLLHKDLEQTISIHNLELRAQRIRAGLVITETVGRQLDASSALLALGREILTQLGMTAALVAEDTPDGPRLMHVLGSIPRSTNPEALFGQRNPLRTCLQSGKPIVVPNLDVNDEWRETALLSTLRSKGFICLPVNVEGKTIAAVLAVNVEPMAQLTDEDVQVYHQIARQSSVILQNISLLNETRRRLQEVNLLLDFSRQLGGLDPTGIVEALLISALRVIPSAHAGSALLWDERSVELKPRAVSGYADDESLMRINYRSGEALPGKVFEEQQPRRVDEVNFAADYILPAESLLRYREATGGRLPISSMLIPIHTGRRGLGLLILDNFNTPAAFTEDDQALLLSLAQQVALSLENVRLMNATQERAGQLQALNDVATKLSASLQSDELVGSLLEQLSSVVPYDTATLWLREGNKLTVAAARGFEDTDQRIGLTVAVEDSALFNQMIRTRQEISVNDVREDDRFHVVDTTRLSWLGIPLISKGEVSGVIALEKWEPSFYTREHIQVATTFTSQAAVAMDNAHLYEDSLNRAAELDRRSQRLALLNHFSSELSGMLDSEKIMAYTADELKQATNASRVSLVVVDGNHVNLTREMPKSKRKLPVELANAPIFHHLRETLGIFTTENPLTEPSIEPLVEVIGFTEEPVLVLTLVGGGDLRALLFLQANKGNRFSTNEIELARTITNQASIATENARLYQSTVFTAERFSVLSEVSYEISASLDPEQIYPTVHEAAKRLMPVDAFVISLLDEEQNDIVGVYLVDKDKRTPAQRIPLDSGLSGQVISSGEPLLISGSENAEKLGDVTYGDKRTPDSILAVPMRIGDKVLGMLSAQNYQDNVYTQDDLKILSTIANQAIVAIQNSRLFEETQRLAEELEQRVVERTAQLQREQQNTETLLRILTEVSASLDLDRALNRTLSLLNDAIGAEQGTIMLVHAEDNLLHYRAGYGYLDDRTSKREPKITLKIGEGLAGWVVKNRKAALVDDLLEDERWLQTTRTREHRSSITCPLLVGEDVIGVLMVFHREPSYFNPEQLYLVQAIASQVAVAINNAHLYELIRDQAERLGGMLRREQEDASRSQAILEAVADGVLVTGPDNQITFLNSSAERILDLDTSSVIGRSLDVFGGLFGKAANTWMQTVRNWSEDTTSYEMGETYAEQLELEDKRIVMVHLAPVILSNDFLGTVSIFRDITHEVEVDRLKSEFVATVSHELRTPMTSIRGYVDILLMGAAGALNENQVHFLDIVKDNTERLATLVNDLLDISRIEAGRITLSMQPIELKEVADDVIAEILRVSNEEDKEVAVSLDVAKDLPRVYGDIERVRQILNNLVDNAYHYTGENGKITLRLQLDGESDVRVDVIDNGVGILPEEQDRIFERFYRGENPYVLATPGTGLGLSIVKQLIEMHNGRIWMKSTGKEGEGSTFSFTLPVYETE